MTECGNESISKIIIQEHSSGDAKIPDSKETKLNMELKNRLRKYLKKLDGNALKHLFYIYLPFRVDVDALGLLKYC